MLDYVNCEPFIFMSCYDRCEVYFEGDLVYCNVRDSIICYLYRHGFLKIVSWNVVRKYKTYVLFSIQVVCLDLGLD
jgi:hypothetical protein